MGINVGVGSPAGLAGASAELVLGWARRADAGSFSSLAVIDRLAYGNLEPLATLAAAAAVTGRIRLATTILIAPLRPLRLLAKQAASVDALSGGRLTLGLAVGARGDDYAAAGVDHPARGRLLTEHLVSLRELADGARFAPRPARPGGLEVLVGGTTGSALVRMARYAAGYVHSGGPPRAFAAAAERARTAWADAGRPGEPRLWGMGYVALGRAAEPGRAYLRDYYAFTGAFAERIAQEALTSPRAVTEFVAGYADAGCHELVLFPTVADPEQLDRLADAIG